MTKKSLVFILVVCIILSTMGFNVSASSQTGFQKEEKILVVLIEFTETEESLAQYEDPYYDGTIKKSDSEYSDFFFGTEGITIRNYFREVSNGRLDLLPAEENSNVANDGVVRVKLNIPHPNDYGDLGTLSYDAIASIFENAFINSLDPIIDFSVFDKNSDGFLTSSEELHIFFVLASSKGATKPITRGFAMNMDHFMNNRTVDNLRFKNLGIEFVNESSAISTYCHELAHDMGAIDLAYDQEKYSIVTESLMSGFYCHLDPWHKIMLGFVDPIDVTASGTYTVYSVDPNDWSRYNVLRILLDDKNPNYDEYLLIENRQPVGADANLGNRIICGGIAIWHIATEKGNFNNLVRMKFEDPDSNRYEIDYRRFRQNQFYYNVEDGENGGNVIRVPHIYYNYYTEPSSNLFDGTPSGVSVKIESPSSPEMMVTVDFIDAPENLRSVSNDTISWDPVEDASGYIVHMDEDSFSIAVPFNEYTVSHFGKHTYVVRAKNYSNISKNSKNLNTTNLLYGDINLDGTIDDADKEVLSNYLSNNISQFKDEQKLVADLNGDKVINSTDLQLLNRYLNGVITQFPVGKSKLIVYGDINQDGMVTMEDFENFPSNGENLDIVQRIAADVYGDDDKINLLDKSELLSYIEGSKKRMSVMNIEYSELIN